MKHENPQEAFQKAIDSGRLNENENSDFYAGKWMYMFTDESGVDQFKNSNTRHYLYVSRHPFGSA
jgi:hypothetical protein